SHDRAFAELLFDLTQGGGERLLAVVFHLRGFLEKLSWQTRALSAACPGNSLQDYHTNSAPPERSFAGISAFFQAFCELPCTVSTESSYCMRAAADACTDCCTRIHRTIGASHRPGRFRVPLRDRALRAAARNETPAGLDLPSPLTNVST